MSYPPPSFRETDGARLRAALAEATLGILVTQSAGGPLASHIPFLFDPSAGAQGVLLFHVARSNPQAKPAAEAAPALVLFPGPDAYVSPSFYATKPHEPRVVPTWNYRAIHVRGRLEKFEDTEMLRTLVTRLTERFEARNGSAWQVTDAPEDYVARMLRGIVGLRLVIETIEGRSKLSQNRPAEDQASVAAALGASERAEDRAVAALMGERTKA
jgi:transcriptional regulator